MSFGTTLLRFVKKIRSPFLRRKLKNNNFTIISNNCFGGFVYDNYSLKYLSPTIGLSMPAKDFLKFIKNMDYYLTLDIEEYKNKEEIPCKDFIKEESLENHLDKLFKLGNLTLYGLHYKDLNEIKTKWNRRKTRINKKNIIYKFNDQNCATVEDMKEFLSLPFKNKILFTCNPYYKNSANKSVYYMKMYEGQKKVKDDIFKFHKVINMTNYLNNIEKED